MTRNLKRQYDRMMDDLSRDMDERYKEFLLLKPDVFVYDNLIFDLEHLDSYYNCRHCKKRKRQAFCCSDHDLELTGRDLKTIDGVLPELKAEYPHLSRLLEKDPYWTYGDQFEKIMRKKKNGDCIFLMPGANACYLHAFALEHGLDPLDVKPYVCTLYPVVVVVLDEEDVVITTMNRESMKILDCSEETQPCTSARGRKDEHTIIRSQQILTRMFGTKVYRALHEKVFSK